MIRINHSSSWVMRHALPMPCPDRSRLACLVSR